MEKPTQEQITGWGQVVITPDMPLGAIIHFMNVLNGRLATLENLVSLTLPNGEVVTLTELYRRQAEEEQKNRQETQTVATPKGE